MTSRLESLSYPTRTTFWPRVARRPDKDTPMRLSLRFIIPLLLALAAVAYAILPVVDRFTFRWFVRDLDIRANLIANTVQEPLEDLIRAGNRTRMLQFFTRITADERVYAVWFWPG